jgi:eukaryotic-like serine/threonine-protein kinase
MPKGTASSGPGNEEPTRVMPPGQAFPNAEATKVMPPGRVFANATPARATQPPPPTRPALDFSKNRQIGRFEMIREIARGGQGQVFLARDTQLGRKVAIKFLLRDDPDFVQRFLVEARATARCTHENIITIYEVGEHDGLPYMVLEYLEGKTLSEVLAAHPSQRQFVELMVPVLRALERAHEHGIVHRDLKPSNIFVTDRGQVKVLDFGVARLIDRTAGLTDAAAGAVDPRAVRLDDAQASVTFTGSNSLVGTLPYMSPEQWGADAVDHLSDLWAVGIMFWRAFTDVHPAGTTAPDKLRARLCDLYTPLPSIGAQDPNLPPELVAIIDKSLQKVKAERYQSAGEMLADLQRYLAPRVDRAAGEVCPYRGLAAFGEDDAKYFFGRSNEIRTALAQLEAWPLLAVIGPSGVGKSSFVHAGLVPAVRSSGGSWQVRVLRPGRVPLHRLANVLEEAHATNEHGHDVMSQLVESPGLFGTLLRSAAERRNHKVLVVVDQLEELFTLCDSDAIRRQFLAALLAAADDPSSPVRVVLSMRADFLDRLAGHKHFLSELSRGLFFLTAPDQDNLRETLVRPAELAGYGFEDAMIVEDMMHAASTRGALPLLSFAASRLWEARDRDRKLLTIAAYNQMGGVGGAFARHADQVAAAVAPQSQKLLRAILTRLVTPEGTRAVVDHKELVSLSTDAAEVEQILDQLVRARLIHLHTDPDQVATVEIVHEMLITEWPTLKRWLEDSQAMRGFLHELRQAARQWDSHGRSGDLVWRGATAQEALANAKRHVLDLSGVEAAFLDAVRVHERRAARRKVLVVSTIFVVLGVVIAGGAFFTVKLSRANAVAIDREAAATRAAEEAQTARADLQQKLDIIQEKEQARLAAEAQAKVAQDKALAADATVKLSQGELEKANIELRRALADAQAEKQKAQAAAEVARRASDEAKAAKAAAEAAAARERARADKLEKESKSIYNKDLRTPTGGAAPGGGGLK